MIQNSTKVITNIHDISNTKTRSRDLVNLKCLIRTVHCSFVSLACSWSSGVLLHISSSKDEVGTSKLSISINRRRWRSQIVWPTKIKKRPLFGFILSVETSNFIYKAFDKYSLKIELLYAREVFFCWKIEPFILLRL